MTIFTINVSNLTDCSHGCILSQTATGLSLVVTQGGYEGTAWILLCTFLVVSMQLGFAMLEVGNCREAHRMTVLAKNVLDSCVTVLGFWLYCEWSSPGLVQNRQGLMENHLVLFHSAFCANAVTICSGAMAERTHMVAYLLFAVFTSFVIYPPIALGAWGKEGFLSSEFHSKFHSGYDYHDFAGSGVVHVVGGCSALVGIMLLGRRIMKSKEDFDTAETCLDFEDDDFSPEVPYTIEEEHSPREGEHAPEALVARATPETWQRRFDDAERDE